MATFDFFVGAVNVVLAPLAVFPPTVTILLVSTIITSIIFIMNRLIVNKKFVEDLRMRMEQLKENITQAQKENNKENLQTHMSELMKLNNQYVKHTFKTFIVSAVVVTLFLPWLGWKYSAATVGVPFGLPILGTHIEWLYWYILVSFAIGWVSRKLFGSVV